VGHMGLVRALVAGSQHPLERWIEVFARRSPEDAAELAEKDALDPACKRLVVELCHADGAWLAKRRNEGPEAFRHAAEELRALVEMVRSAHPEVAVRVEPALVPRFLYHNGVVFAGYSRKAPQPLLQGGRYDAMMRAHGRELPAVGFSMDLWTWLDVLEAEACR
ncbi:MAG: ATP phosphoribosyltransferase regulatory subunit, partial [Zetaproteobacteria bacterium]